MARFGFSITIIDCVYNLLAYNIIKVNILGYFTNSVRKKSKSLNKVTQCHQFCAIWPSNLFCVAFFFDKNFHGYEMTTRDDIIYNGDHPTSTSTKLCYADDVLVLIHNPADLRYLKEHMDLFYSASDTRFNYNKTKAFSLSGRPIWSYWENDLQSIDITKLHSSEDTSPIIYLGFPLIQLTAQRLNFITSLVSKLKAAAAFYSTRSSPLLGRVTVINSLIFSKCWYLFRVTPFTQADLLQIRSIGVQFVNQNVFSKITWIICTLPRSQGGLQTIDPATQQLTLYFR
jgi:hypothetical protein